MVRLSIKAGESAKVEGHQFGIGGITGIGVKVNRKADGTYGEVRQPCSLPVLDREDVRIEDELCEDPGYGEDWVACPEFSTSVTDASQTDNRS